MIGLFGTPACVVLENKKMKNLLNSLQIGVTSLLHFLLNDQLDLLHSFEGIAP